MKLYYVKVPNDAAGDALIAEHRSVIEDVKGAVTLSRSFGVGDAVVVLTLPDAIQPADVGLPEAELRMDLIPDEPQETHEDAVQAPGPGLQQD